MLIYACTSAGYDVCVQYAYICIYTPTEYVDMVYLGDRPEYHLEQVVIGLQQMEQTLSVVGASQHRSDDTALPGATWRKCTHLTYASVHVR